MLFIKRAGIVAPLPQVAGSKLALAVDVARKAGVRAPERLGHGHLLLRQDNPMDVIRHEAPSVKFQAVRTCRGHDVIEIDFAVLIGGKDFLPIVAALGHVVSKPRDDHASEGRHRDESQPSAPFLSDFTASVRICRICAHLSVTES